MAREDIQSGRGEPAPIRYKNKSSRAGRTCSASSSLVFTLPGRASPGARPVVSRSWREGGETL
jgi:hypothetical protein